MRNVLRLSFEDAYPNVRSQGESFQNHLYDYAGGLNGSTQHHVEICLLESQQLESFASIDSNGHCPGWF